MNDQFLHSLRRDPPPVFARRLKQKLQSQQTRRSWSLGSRILLLLMFGSAFAGGTFVFQRYSAGNSQPSQAHAQMAPETPTISPPPPQPRHAPNDPAPDASGTPNKTASGESRRSRPAGAIATSPLAQALVGQMLTDQRRESAAPEIQTLEADAAFTSLCAPGNDRPFDLIVTSRRITHAEFMNCRNNGVNRIIEAKLGYQVLVLTSARDSLFMKLSAGDVYLALARQIPDPVDLSRLIMNTNSTWDQVNDNFTYRPIAVFGPMRDTPLRSLFENLLLDPGCNAQQTIKALLLTAPDRHAELCHALRDDRLYSEVEQTANLIPQQLWADPHGFVLVDYQFYLQNKAQLGGSALEGPEPSSATLADGTYPLARPIYLYADETRVGRMAGAFDQLHSLRRFGLSGPNPHGFVRLPEEKTEPASWRRKSPLAESDLVPERSAPR
jgi:phosphate transport system substrate-binding protein